VFGNYFPERNVLLRREVLASFDLSQNKVFWPKADIEIAPRNGRFQG
jgi:hypothetical protein